MELASFHRPCALNFEAASTFLEICAPLLKTQLYFCLTLNLNSTEAMQNFMGLKIRSKFVVYCSSLQLVKSM